MALVQPVRTEQIQARIDQFATTFFEMESLAQSLIAFRANLTPANIAAGWLKDDAGAAMPEAVRAELDARLGALQTFVTWANTGNPSPLAYLRGVKRAV